MSADPAAKPTLRERLRSVRRYFGLDPSYVRPTGPSNEDLARARSYGAGRADLPDADLSDADLSDGDLSECDLAQNGQNGGHRRDVSECDLAQNGQES